MSSVPPSVGIPEFAQPTFAKDANFTPGQWHGKYRCPFGQYEAHFPHPEVAAKLHISGYKDGAVILTRVDYGMGVMANIVMSSLPQGRDAATEMNRQLDMAFAHEEAAGRPMGIEPHMSPELGHLLHLTVRDVASASAEGPYPLAMAFNERVSDAAFSVSTHRVFVMGSHRFEIAVFQQLPADMAPSAEHEATMLAQVNDIAAFILASMVEASDLVPGEEVAIP